MALKSEYNPSKDKNFVDADEEQQLGEAAAQTPSTATPTFVESPTPDPDEQYEENAGGYQGKTDVTGGVAPGGGTINGATQQPVVTSAPGGGTINGATQQPVVTSAPGNEEKKPTYLADWGADGVNLQSVYDQGKYSLAQLINDRNVWAKDNGKDPVDIVEMWKLSHPDSYLNKTKEEIDAEEKKLKNQEKWERFGNVLLHLGNFVGTIAGAPSQKLESAQELTKRQQMLRDKTKKLRDTEFNEYFDALYKQQRNNLERRKQDRLDQEAKISKAKGEAYINAQRAKVLGDEAKSKYWQVKADLLERGYSLEEAESKAKVAETESRTRLNNVRANAGGFAPRSNQTSQAKETTTVTTDARGRKSTRTTRTGPVGTTGGSLLPGRNGSGRKGSLLP